MHSPPIDSASDERRPDDPAEKIPALTRAYRDFPLLRPEETIDHALDTFRRTGLSPKIIYFYVADAENRLLGVLPTRILLTAPLAARVGDVFVRKAIALPARASLADARVEFRKHKFLAFPIVDDGGRVLGVLNIEQFAGDLGDIHSRTGYDDIFELIGLTGGIKSGTRARRAFRLRFPWLIASLVTGTCAAWLTSRYEVTLEHAIILAFFLALVLGLNESVCMQSATVAVQRLHEDKPDFRGFLRALGAEARTGGLLGLACAICVYAISWLWFRHPMSSFTLALSIGSSVFLSCLWGFGIPFLLRKLRLDPRVAAAPVALGLADLTTLGLYFSLATWLLT